jgi:cytochrome d ubiquinol oxidase subunit II
MTLESLLAGSILISVVFYAVLGGADYGGGVWDLLASGKRAQIQRKIIAEAMGPVWEANHVWLILVIVVLFTAFPAAFARLSIVFHIPLSIALMGIVLRGCAFTFRHYHSDGGHSEGGPSETGRDGSGSADDHREKHAASDELEWRWGRVFAIASLLTPLLLGTVLGGIYAGRARADAGFMHAWLAPFPVTVGIFTLCLFAYLAATYLTVESASAPGVQADFRWKALWSGAATILAGGTVLLVGREANIRGAHGMSAWVWPLRAVTLMLAVAALLATKRRFFRTAQTLVILQVALIIAGWGARQYPYLIPPDITIPSAAAPQATLWALTAALTGGALVLFPSFYYLFYIFKGSMLSSTKH